MCTWFRRANVNELYEHFCTTANRIIENGGGGSHPAALQYVDLSCSRWFSTKPVGVGVPREKIFVATNLSANVFEVPGKVFEPSRISLHDTTYGPNGNVEAINCSETATRYSRAEPGDTRGAARSADDQKCVHRR